MFVPPCLLGYPIQSSLSTAPENILQNKLYQYGYLQSRHKHASLVILHIINFHRLAKLRIYRHSRTSLSDMPENIVWNKTAIIYNTNTHTCFIHNCAILHYTKFPHQSELIQKLIPSSQIIYPLVESESSRFKHKL